MYHTTQYYSEVDPISIHNIPFVNFLGTVAALYNLDSVVIYFFPTNNFPTHKIPTLYIDIDS